MTLETYANVILTMTAPIPLLFAFFYVRRSPWKAHRVSRSILYDKIAIGVVLLVFVASLWLGRDYVGRQVVRAIVYTGVFLAQVGMLAVLLLQQARTRRTGEQSDYTETIRSK